MSDFEQRTEEYGTAILKLVRVKEASGSNTRLFGNIVFSMKHYKENDSEMMLVRIIPVSSSSIRPIKSISGNASDQLSINKMYALLQKAPVMVFDDSLSAVDTRTDHEIRKALKEHQKDATVILISHRITTLMGSDRILVLNRGRVEETGTHEELIAKDGIYRQIYEIQMDREKR